MNTSSKILLAVLTAGFLFGCSAVSTATPSASPSPSQTPAPTAVPATVAAPAAYSGAAAALDQELEAIFQKVSPSIVEITVVQKAGSGSSANSGSGPEVVSGSGFVWDTQGNIVTNNHVIQNAASILVSFPDGNEADATLVGADPGSDLAVIRVSLDPSLLPPVTLGDSSKVQVGQTAIVIGYPFGLDITMTYGIVSGVSRLLPVSASDGSGLSYSIPDVIQTDAPINPGNSGGVLLNDLGEVVGVPSANISTSGSSAGVGFAIPSNIVSVEVPVLISTGSYPHAYLGIAGETLTSELASAMGLDPSTRGLLIDQVEKGGPADKAGLRGSTKTVTIRGLQANIGGDIITSADGQPINDFEDMIRYMFLNKKIGDTMQLTILRDGKSQTVELTFS
jgi:S1-C subfamily serine protease